MTEFNYADRLFRVKAQVDGGVLVGTVTTTLDNGDIRVTIDGMLDLDGTLEDYTITAVLDPYGGIRDVIVPKDKLEELL